MDLGNVDLGNDADACNKYNVKPFIVYLVMEWNGFFYDLDVLDVLDVQAGADYPRRVGYQFHIRQFFYTLVSYLVRPQVLHVAAACLRPIKYHLYHLVTIRVRVIHRVQTGARPVLARQRRGTAVDNLVAAHINDKHVNFLVV